MRCHRTNVYDSGVIIHRTAIANHLMSGENGEVSLTRNRIESACEIRTQRVK
jgi:hypothetical protein